METAEMTAIGTFDGQFPSDNYKVHFDFDGLRVGVSNDDEELVASFRDFIGFRFLDEGDLLEFWSDSNNAISSWVREVQSGGWHELESTRQGFLSSDRKGLKEYLVVSLNGCLSVLAFSEPELSRPSV